MLVRYNFPKLKERETYLLLFKSSQKERKAGQSGYDKLGHKKDNIPSPLMIGIKQG